MKENYQSWQINIDSFPSTGSLNEQLKFLINFPILAPSGHNSQPWNFSVNGNEISIWKNEERSLAQSDPTMRQLLIASGCALENLIIAADYYGFESQISYFPEKDNSNLIAKILLKKLNVMEGKNRNDHLIFAIPKRHTNRNKYKDQQLPADFLMEINRLSNEICTISVISEKRIKDEIADIVNNAQIEAMDDSGFREELSHYIKSNFTKEKVGMPGFTLGIPAPISLIASRLIKKINLSRKSKKKDEDLLKKFTPAFIIINGTQDDRTTRIKTGQLFERIWLTAEKYGLNCAPLAAAVQSDVYAKKLQAIFKTNSKPLVFFRVGYSNKSVRHSPRLSLEEVLKNHN